MSRAHKAPAVHRSTKVGSDGETVETHTMAMKGFIRNTIFDHNMKKF